MTATNPSWTITTLRWIKLEGVYHPVYLDCDTCRGHGTIMGGDESQPCPGCALRFADFQRIYRKVTP